MKNKNESSYLDSVHRLGRIGSFGAVSIMVGIPFVMSYIYGQWPDMPTVIKASVGLLALFIPVAIAEVISFMPVLGSAGYISYITGNVINLKLPCAINAMELADVDQGTEAGDVIATLSIAISSLTTMAIIALGVLLLVPLTPIFENPNVNIATQYMLPALFGGMFTTMLYDNKVGDCQVKGKLLPILLPMLVIFVVNKFIKPLQGYEGFLMIVVIPTTVLIAKVLYDKNIIKMNPIEKK